MAADPITPRRNGRPRQVEFPPLQTHSKAFEAFMVGFAILCVVIVLVIVLGTDIGTLTR
jgi:hypothetical protein